MDPHMADIVGVRRHTPSHMSNQLASSQLLGDPHEHHSPIRTRASNMFHGAPSTLARPTPQHGRRAQAPGTKEPHNVKSGEVRESSGRRDNRGGEVSGSVPHAMFPDEPMFGDTGDTDSQIAYVPSVGPRRRRGVKKSTSTLRRARSCVSPPSQPRPGHRVRRTVSSVVDESTDYPSQQNWSGGSVSGSESGVSFSSGPAVLNIGAAASVERGLHQLPHPNTHREATTFTAKQRTPRSRRSVPNRHRHAMADKQANGAQGANKGTETHHAHGSGVVLPPPSSTPSGNLLHSVPGHPPTSPMFGRRSHVSSAASGATDELFLGTPRSGVGNGLNGLAHAPSTGVNDGPTVVGACTPADLMRARGAGGRDTNSNAVVGEQTQAVVPPALPAAKTRVPAIGGASGPGFRRLMRGAVNTYRGLHSNNATPRGGVGGSKEKQGTPRNPGYFKSMVEKAVVVHKSLSPMEDKLHSLSAQVTALTEHLEQARVRWWRWWITVAVL